MTKRPTRTSAAASSARRLMALIGVVATALSLVVAAAVTGSAARAATVPLSVKIVGKHFVNGSGTVIRLLGVNYPSAEYGCIDGFGYDDGHFTDADAKAIASWAVHDHLHALATG